MLHLHVPTTDGIRTLIVESAPASRANAISNIWEWRGHGLITASAAKWAEDAVHHSQRSLLARARISREARARTITRTE